MTRDEWCKIAMDVNELGIKLGPHMSEWPEEIDDWDAIAIVQRWYRKIEKPLLHLRSQVGSISIETFFSDSGGDSVTISNLYTLLMDWFWVNKKIDELEDFLIHVVPSAADLMPIYHMAKHTEMYFYCIVRHALNKDYEPARMIYSAVSHRNIKTSLIIRRVTEDADLSEVYRFSTLNPDVEI